MSYLMNSSEILQTIQMIDQQHLDVRTVTMGISLLDCAADTTKRCAGKVYDKICRCAEHLVPECETIEQEYGIPIVNKRVSVTPISLVAASCAEQDYSPIALAMDKAAAAVGINFIGGFSALAQKGFTESDRRLVCSIPTSLSETELVCSSVNVGSTKAGINMDAVLLCGRIIRETAAFTAVRYGLIAEIPEDPVIYRRTSFGKTDVNGNSIVFRITRNDKVMTRKDMENDDVSLQVTDLSVDNSNVTGFLNSFGNTPADCRIRVEEDGTIYLMPARPPVLALAPFLIDCGDYHVTVAVNQDETLTGEADFTIQGGWGEWKYPFILLILLLLILYLLYIFFVKYKFHGQKVHVDYYKMLTDGSGIKEKNKGGTYTLDFFSPDLFLPRRACHRNIMGLDVVADGMVVRVTGKSIQSGYAKYGQAAVSEKMALKRLSTVVSRLTPTRDEKGKAKDTADQYLTGKPIYFQRGPKDREIIAIYMEE